MAANLLKAGFPLTVYNRTAAKAQPLAELGAVVAASPAEAVKGASVVISMLADDNASRETWTAALPAIAAGAVLVESSTVSPEWIVELDGLAKAHGAELLDAPVTGSKAQAEGGQLNFLVGGSDAALEKATPALKPMSKEIVHLGPVGSGARVKLINNFLCGVQIASLAEALTWIERSGLDREKTLTVLKSGAPGSPLLAGISARMVKQDYAVNFLLKLMSKDLHYAHQEAENFKVELKTAETAQSYFKEAIAEGRGEQDMSSVVEVLRAR